MRQCILITICLLFALNAAPAQTEERDRAIELFHAGKYQEAAEILRKIVEAQPYRNRVAWTVLGGALMNLGQEREAVEAFIKREGLPGFQRDDGPAYQPSEFVPIKILERPNAVYTAEAKARGVQGTVTLMVEFKADGTIGFAVPIKSLPYGLTENAVTAAKTMKFVPSTIKSRKIPEIAPISYQFDIWK